MASSPCRKPVIGTIRCRSDFDWHGIKADAGSLSAQAMAVVAIALLYGRSRIVERRRAAAQRAAD